MRQPPTARFVPPLEPLSAEEIARRAAEELDADARLRGDWTAPEMARWSDPTPVPTSRELREEEAEDEAWQRTWAVLLVAGGLLLWAGMWLGWIR